MTIDWDRLWPGPRLATTSSLPYSIWCFGIAHAAYVAENRDNQVWDLPGILYSEFETPFGVLAF